MCFDWAHLDNSGSSLHLKVIALTTSAKTLKPCTGSETWGVDIFGGHYSPTTNRNTFTLFTVEMTQRAMECSFPPIPVIHGLLLPVNISPIDLNQLTCTHARPTSCHILA